MASFIFSHWYTVISTILLYFILFSLKFITDDSFTSFFYYIYYFCNTLVIVICFIHEPLALSLKGNLIPCSGCNVLSD